MARVCRAAAALLVAAVPTLFAQSPVFDPAFGSCGVKPDPAISTNARQSQYLTMRDGVRLAATIRLPGTPAAGRRWPTILQTTPYWRGWEGSSVAQHEEWVRHGYAAVVVDVRGTGASFGRWVFPWSPEEVADLKEIVAWIAAQPWSDGTIGTIGGSYLGNTAQLAATTGHPAVKLVVPQYFDWDAFADVTAFGGLANTQLLDIWGTFIGALNANEPRKALFDRDGLPRGVDPVDGDSGNAWLQAAVASHRDNPPFGPSVRSIQFRDDSPPGWQGRTIEDFNTYRQARRLAATRVPIIGWVGWQDGATATGAIARFLTLNNVPQQLIIGPWSHGAFFDTSPYQAPDRPVQPTRQEQAIEVLCGFERHLKGAPLKGREILYYTLGEEQWNRTTTWPLPGTRMVRWFLGPAGTLGRRAPTAETGSDRYQVDFEAGTGETNRWLTGATGRDVFYADRRDADRRLQVYDTPPLEHDTEVTGQPVITVWMRSTHDDGAIHAYLEDVAPDGTVRMLTEGALRAIHRSESPAPYRTLAPYHSMNRADARPLVPGQWARLRFGLVPISVVFRRGHRIRLAIAGADKDAFDRVPAQGQPVIDIGRQIGKASFIELPVVRHR